MAVNRLKENTHVEVFGEPQKSPRVEQIIKLLCSSMSIYSSWVPGLNAGNHALSLDVHYTDSTIRPING